MFSSPLRAFRDLLLGFDSIIDDRMDSADGLLELPFGPNIKGPLERPEGIDQDSRPPGGGGGRGVKDLDERRDGNREVQAVGVCA